VLAVGTASWIAVVRLRAATPTVSATFSSPSTWIAVAGAPPAITSPPQGSLAVDAVAGGTAVHLAAADAATVRPMASVAKTMTALVILEAHPLVAPEPGLVITINSTDVGDYHRIAAQGGSVAPVTLGERLSERDLLLGLMLPSGNNLALTGARWIDGTVDAFVARLNTRAATLRMPHTHFVDPDGLDPGTTSTAADLVLLGEAAVANDALVSVVSTTTATLPDGTVVGNLDRLLGSEPGWIGVKTGWTPQASGCLLFAARRTAQPSDPPLTVVGAVLGQPPDAVADPDHPELGGAFAVARAAVENALAGYALATVGVASIPIDGSVTTPWGEVSGIMLTGSDHVVLVRRGASLSVSTAATGFTAPAPASTRAGALTVSLDGIVVGSWSLVTTERLDGPSTWWRLMHG
jgi:D-alanyl-D-alanine carboxypeptidase (penicillin-binding protein 5/6)